MKNLTKQELRIIADNNNISVMELKKQHELITKKNVRTLKAIVLSFIIGLTILSIIF
jgi:hypothetical protein